ncbi:hypothetical protein HN011_011839 [Eciton burchellii]|nr:hypothetical protein HN011_011839 [Eciton burchellii]
MHVIDMSLSDIEERAGSKLDHLTYSRSEPCSLSLLRYFGPASNPIEYTIFLLFSQFPEICIGIGIRTTSFCPIALQAPPLFSSFSISRVNRQSERSKSLMCTAMLCNQGTEQIAVSMALFPRAESKRQHSTRCAALRGVC